MSEPGAMTDAKKPSHLNQIHQLGMSLYKQGDFVAALPLLIQFCSLSDKTASEYSEAVFARLRILSEMNLQDDRFRLEAEILESIATLDNKGLATFYYLKAYNFVTEQKNHLAAENYDRALSEAIKSESREMIAQALFGCIFIALSLEKTDPTLDAKIKKLELLVAEINKPELIVSILSLKADIALSNGDPVKALHWVWDAYDKVKFTKNNFLSLSIIAKIGHVYLMSGKFEEAKIYLELAQRSVDASVYKRLSQGVEQLLGQLPKEASKKYDLILDEKNHLIVEKDKGPIDMKNQFILIDLLKLLMVNSGKPVSKEQLVEHVWHQKYEPKTHDNTIYVTIKRIRTLIEPNPSQSVYILRNREGYLFNSDKKICITSKESAL